VSFEVFGQLHNLVGEEPGDREAFFAACVRRWVAQLGITSVRTEPGAQEREHELEAVRD
jgi:hypothetical protein